MRAEDVLRQRRELCASFTRTITEPWPADAPHAEGSDEYHAMMHGAREGLKILPGCRCYFMTTDMCEVARAAVASLPVDDLDASAVPEPAGFLLAEQSLGKVVFPGDPFNPDVMAAAWRFQHGRLQVIPFIDLVPYGGSSTLMMTGGGARIEWSPGRQAWHNDPDTGKTDLSVASTLLAALVLMRQPLAVTERQLAGRGERRLSQRASLPAEYTVLRLRQPKRATAAAGDKTQVAWSHRWMVSGHWTHQAYGPARSLRKLLFVPAYVKGPADKPLMIKERVTAWVR